MNGSREGLLQPTLGQDAQPAAAPYSVQATFFTAFFGGPFAALALIAVNSSRLKRLGRDLPALAACLMAVVLLGWVLQGSGLAAAAPLRDWLDANVGERNYRYVYRFLALLIVGIGYLLHRREQRNTDLLGLARPNGWIAGAICGVGGAAVLAAFIAFLLRG
jgi:hypothetical protein